MSNRKSIDPLIWGKGFWESIHYAAVDYAVADKAGFEAYFASLKFTLPCENCRAHYTNFWNTYSILPYLEQDEKLREWTLLLHNTVNLRLGKPTWTLAQFNAKYDVREDDEDEEKEEKTHLSLIVQSPASSKQRPRIQVPAYIHVGNGKRIRPTIATAPATKKKCKNCGKKGGP